MRKEGWYWIRIAADEPPEPAQWWPDMNIWRASGAGYEESEVLEVGPAIPVPPEMMNGPPKPANPRR